MTSGLRQTRCDPAAGNYRILMPLAGELQNVGERRDLAVLDKKLNPDVFDKENDGVPVVLNAIAAHQLGFDSPEAAVGQTLQRMTWEGKLLSHRIVGVA